MSTRVRCPHCDHRAKIVTARNQSELTREIYYQCQNFLDCGFAWVALLSAVRTIQPSRIPKQSVYIPMSDRSHQAAGPPSG